MVLQQLLTIKQLDDQVILTGDNFVRTNFTKTAVINFAKGKHTLLLKKQKILILKRH